MTRTVLTTTLAALACAAVVSAQAAQAPQTPAPPSQPPAAVPQTPDAPTRPVDDVTLVGCLERSRPDGSSATPGAVGTTGAVGDSGFILTKVKPPATVASSAPASPPPAATYRLDGDVSKLTGDVGHKVEVTGTFADRPASSNPRSGGSADTPRLQMESMKMISMVCTE